MEQHFFVLLARNGVWLFGAQIFGVVGLPIPDEALLTLAGGLVRSGNLPALQRSPPPFPAASSVWRSAMRWAASARVCAGIYPASEAVR
jgi:hypothetical protein